MEEDKFKFSRVVLEFFFLPYYQINHKYAKVDREIIYSAELETHPSAVSNFSCGIINWYPSCQHSNEMGSIEEDKYKFSKVVHYIPLPSLSLKRSRVILRSSWVMI